MILVDTGPLVALFDPADGSHAACVEHLKKLREPLLTTIPVLTEATHLLDPGSAGTEALMRFASEGGMRLWFFDDRSVSRAFELMRRYADHPMDLADASLVVAAEATGNRRIFTLDRTDFGAYRIRRGHRQLGFEVV